MTLQALLSLFLSIISGLVHAQTGPTGWSASPLNAPSFPLAVKTPYMNAWHPQGNQPAAISNFWPRIGSTFFSVTISLPIIYLKVYFSDNV